MDFGLQFVAIPLQPKFPPGLGMVTENKIPPLNDLLLRDGDVIEVPDKP
jgi:hypothetical protein